LADIHHVLGMALRQMGRLPEAGAEFGAALAILRRLAGDNPGVTEFRSHQADSHIGLGVTLVETGRSEEAEAEYRAALALFRRLVDENPAITEFQSRLALAHGNLGNLLKTVHKPAEAETEYRRAGVLVQKLADENPGVTEFRQLRAGNQINLGHLLAMTGRPAEAQATFGQAIPLIQKLIDESPKVLFFQYLLVEAFSGLGDVASGQRREAEARDAYDRAIVTGERLLKERTTNPAYRLSLANALRRRAVALRDRIGDLARAAADARRALELFDGLPSPSDGDWFAAACCRAVLTGLAGRAGSGVPAGEATSEGDAAMGLVRKAVEMGYRSMDAYRTEGALDPLRGREDFKLLMMDLAFPAEPLARAE
jgi:tetratricopeptide (TPR) repeat protein